jgi:FkbM family methyltransferase
MEYDCRYGLFNLPEVSDLIFDSLRIYGEWAQKEIDILNHFIESGDNVIDVGAFIGTHSRAFSEKVGTNGTVYSFEANPVTLSHLQLNAQLADNKNITTYGFALGDPKTENSLQMTFCEGNQGGTHIDSITGNSKTIPIQIHALDEFNFKKINFIKADIEGMEDSFLRGAENLIKLNSPRIFVEVNSLHAGQKVIEWCNNNNYQAHGVITDAFNPDNVKGSPANIYGHARECGLLLIHTDDLNKLKECIKLGLMNVITVDDLALLMLHKPQFFNEVLQLSPVAKQLGIEFWTPAIGRVINKLNQEQLVIAELREQNEKFEVLLEQMRNIRDL